MFGCVYFIAFTPVCYNAPVQSDFLNKNASTAFKLRLPGNKIHCFLQDQSSLCSLLFPRSVCALIHNHSVFFLISFFFSVSVTCEFFVFELSVLNNLSINYLSLKGEKGEPGMMGSSGNLSTKVSMIVNVDKRTMKTNEIFQIFRDVQLSSCLISAFLRLNIGQSLDKVLCYVHNTKL